MRSNWAKSMSLQRMLALTLALSLLTWACADEGQEESLPNGITITITRLTPTPTPAPTPTAAATPTPLPTPTPTLISNVCLFNPDPATAEELQVLAPSLQEGQEVLETKSPLHVVGWSADIGRNDMAVTIALIELVNDQMQLMPIFDTEGVQGFAVEATALPRDGQEPPPGLEVTEFTAPFAENIGFQVEEPKPACLWVFVQPLGSTEAQNVVQVPLRLLP